MFRHDLTVPGRAGRVATFASELETLEQRLLLSADLWGDCNFGRGNFSSYLAPGDRGTIRYIVHNTGDATARGTIQSDVYLSTDPTLAPSSDVLLASGVKAYLKLRPGSAKGYDATVSLPLDLPAGSYYLIVDINTTGAVAEDDTSNDIAVSTTTQDTKFLFGRFHNRTIALTLQDTSGAEPVAVTFSMSGGGYGVIDADSTPTSPGYSITLKGTCSRTDFRMTTAAGATTSLRYLGVQGAIDDIEASSAKLTGDLLVNKTAGSIRLGDVGSLDGSHVTLLIDHEGGGWADIELGSVQNFSIDSSQRIGDLTAVQWLTDSHDLIAAPAMDRLTITGDGGSIAGDLEADVQVGGHHHYTHTYIGTIDVAGTVRDATIRSDRDIDHVTIGAAVGSDFLAGVLDGVTQPRDLDDYVTERHGWFWHHEEAISRIGTFTVTGLGSTPDALFFVDSNIAAGSIDEVTLRNVAYDNGGQTFGIFAAEDNDYGRPIGTVWLVDTASDTTTTLHDHDFSYRDTDFVIRIV